MEGDLGFRSLNTRGLRDQKKRVGLFNWLKKNKCSSQFVLLQETHSCIGDEKSWIREWGNCIYFSHGDRDSRGVAILCPSNIDVKIEKVADDCDYDGRLLLLKLYFENSTILLGNVYAPNQVSGQAQARQTDFLRTVRSILDEHLGCNMVIGGDFNTHLNPALDKQNAPSDVAGRGSPSERSQFADDLLSFCEEYDLTDCWRILNPSLRRYTWRQGNPLRQSRLDYWFISCQMMNNISCVDIKPSFKSDHTIV